METSGYRFRIYPNKEQERLIRRTAGSARFVYNYFLAQRKETGRKIMPTAWQTGRIPALMNKNEWLKEVNPDALYHAVYNLSRACTDKKNSEYPAFKCKKKSKQSFYVKGVKVSENHIEIPRIGKVKAAISRMPDGRILSATISFFSTGKFFASITVADKEVKKKKKTGKNVGIDLGVKTLVTASDKTVYRGAQISEREDRKLRRLQRRVSRKQKDSSNREKAKKDLAIFCEYLTNRRNDALHKITTSIVGKYDTICMEDLATESMKKDHCLASAISDSSFYEIKRMLMYKTKWYGKDLVIVPRHYPSTRICSACGNRNDKAKDLSVRNWTCPVCGKTHERDLNASINILNEGLRIKEKLKVGRGTPEPKRPGRGRDSYSYVALE